MYKSSSYCDSRPAIYKANGQWSPLNPDLILNPDVKKQYTREFLLKLQNAIEKPVGGLPDIPDIILDKPQSVCRHFARGMITRNEYTHDDFTPKYWNCRGGRSMSQGLSRPPTNHINKSWPVPRVININIRRAVELHKAKESWKPGYATKDAVQVDTTSEELFKQTKSLLNKITPQKFEPLVAKMMKLPIKTEYELSGVLDIIFEKATSEPSFCGTYASMCKCLSVFQVPSETKPGEYVSFVPELLRLCQREFGKNIKNTEDGAKKEELKHELQYEESKAKRRSLGNIRFICELFKLKMLTEVIMHDCACKLLRTKDPENLECFCKMLTTIGKELDVDKAKLKMDEYFQQIREIVGEKKTSTRVRFMLQDCMDLRTNKWIPRHAVINPKTIDQIREEVEQEKSVLSQQNEQQHWSTWDGAHGDGPPNQMSRSGEWKMVDTSRTLLKSMDSSIEPDKAEVATSSSPEFTTSTEIELSTAADEMVSQVEIKVEYVPAETQQLELGEIVDDVEEAEIVDDVEEASQSDKEQAPYKAEVATSNSPEFTTITEIELSTAADEMVPQVEIKVEYVPAETQQLELGEIVDDVEEAEIVDDVEEAEIVDDVEETEIVDDVEEAEIVDDVEETEIVDDVEEAEIVDDVEEAEIVDDVAEASQSDKEQAVAWPWKIAGVIMGSGLAAYCIYKFMKN